MATAPRRVPALDPRLVRRGMRLSLVEAVAFALMVGLGETYLIADAIRLGATRLEQGLLVTLPLFLGSLGPLVALRALARLPRRKPLAVGAIALQGLNLGALALADLGGVSTPLLLIALASVHHLAGQTAGTGWGSWFGDLVPDDVRGRYFARRNGFVYASISAGLLGGGLLLEAVEGAPAAAADASGGRGFALVFGLAAVARLVSAVLLAATPEPRFAGIAGRVRVGRYLRTARGTRAWRLLIIVFAVQLVVYTAGPYFTPFMLEDLAFTYAEYTVASLAAVALKVAMLPAWGRAIDQHGPRPTFALATVLLALVPLPWLWAKGLGWVLVAQAFSGFSWAGYEVSLFALLLASSYRDTRPHVLAVQSVMNGTAQLAGAMLGAGLAAAAGGELRVLFAVSLGARLAVAAVVPWLVPPTPREPAVGRRTVLLRVIGLRPSGGVGHRPLPGVIDPAEPQGPAEVQEA